MSSSEGRMSSLKEGIADVLKDYEWTTEGRVRLTWKELHEIRKRILAAVAEEVERMPYIKNPYQTESGHIQFEGFDEFFEGVEAQHGNIVTELRKEGST